MRRAQCSTLSVMPLSLSLSLPDDPAIAERNLAQRRERGFDLYSDRPANGKCCKPWRATTAAPTPLARKPRPSAPLRATGKAVPR